jgi:hypothetical protein
MHSLSTSTPSLPAPCRIGGPEVLTFRETILAAAEALGKRREQVRVVALPLLPLRILAAALGMLGMLWPAAAQLAGGLRFMLYASTHDSGGGASRGVMLPPPPPLQTGAVAWMGRAAKARPCPAK